MSRAPWTICSDSAPAQQIYPSVRQTAILAIPRVCLAALPSSPCSRQSTAAMPTQAPREIHLRLVRSTRRRHPRGRRVCIALDLLVCGHNGSEGEPKHLKRRPIQRIVPERRPSGTLRRKRQSKPLHSSRMATNDAVLKQLPVQRRHLTGRDSYRVSRYGEMEGWSFARSRTGSMIFSGNDSLTNAALFSAFIPFR